MRKACKCEKSKFLKSDYGGLECCFRTLKTRCKAKSHTTLLTPETCFFVHFIATIASTFVTDNASPWKFLACCRQVKSTKYCAIRRPRPVSEKCARLRGHQHATSSRHFLDFLLDKLELMYRLSLGSQSCAKVRYLGLQSYAGKPFSLHERVALTWHCQQHFSFFAVLFKFLLLFCM